MKFLVGVIAVLLFTGSYLVAPLSAVAAPTGQVIVTGNVPIDCNLVVQQASAATSIPDISAGNTNLNIATVTETCNSPNGYTVAVNGSNSGDHNGIFVDFVSDDSHPFTFRYNSVSVSVGGIVTDIAAPAFNVQRSVDISYPADNTLSGTVSASYEETLTFIMSAK